MLHRFALAVAIAAGPGASPQDRVTQSGTGTVVVTVLEAGTRTPISGARVLTLSWDGGLTGADGRVRINDVKAASYWIHVSANEHVSTLRYPEGGHHVPAPPLPPPDMPSLLWRERGRETPGTLPVTVKAGETVAVEFLLPRGAVLSGQVVDAQGRPIVRAPVELLDVVTDSTEMRIFRPLRSTVTDAFGRFRVPGLAPYTYYIRVGVEPEAPTRVPVFYPSETSPLKARGIQLRAAETTDVTVQMRAIPPVPV